MNFGTLVWYMLKEEYRNHTTYTSERSFFSFPAIIMAFAFLSALSSQRLLVEVPYVQLMVIIHFSLFLYGMGVGALAFLARQYVERRHGKKNYLVTLPSLLPLRYKTTFLGLYVRDVIFYLVLVIGPMITGLLLAVPLTPITASSVMFLFLTSILSFLFGFSLSFFLSSIYIRSVHAFAFSVGVILFLGVGTGIFKIFQTWDIIPSLAFQLQKELFYMVECLALIGAFTITGYILIQEKFESKLSRVSSRFGNVERSFSFSGKYSPLLAKEFLDLRRSGTVTKMLSSFVISLVFLSFIIWFVRNVIVGFPIEFNSIFYGAMVGFFTVMIYNWLNNVDIVDFYTTLPVTVPQVIKTKLMVFMIITSGISTIFLVLISYLNRELGMLWLSLPVMFVISAYMVVTTAYLTGLRTNSYLFDMSIMLRFTGLTLLPQLFLAILSFSLRTDRTLVVAIISTACFVLLLATYIMYKRIDLKWGRAEFDF